MASLRIQSPLQFWLIPVLRLLTIVGGGLALRGYSLGRWLLLLWLVSHVVISTLHSPFELAVHILVLLVSAFFLYRPTASDYFRLAGNFRVKETE